MPNDEVCTLHPADRLLCAYYYQARKRSTRYLNPAIPPKDKKLIYNFRFPASLVPNDNQWQVVYFQY
jgi:hypothetical protein